MSSVTAIVSAYYAERFLEERLNNLVWQSRQPEIVVVYAPGSPEAEIVRRFVEHYPDYEPGIQGLAIDAPTVPTIYEAWNFAISRAHGDYITNANSDDRLNQDGIAILAETLDLNPSRALVFADLEMRGDRVGRIGFDDEQHDTTEHLLEELMRVCFVGPCPMWRKTLHANYGGFDPTFKVAGDYEFWLRIAQGGEWFLHLDRVIGSYNYRRDSLEHRESLRTIWETARARARYRREVISDDGS